MAEILMTQEGYDALKERLDYLKGTRRLEVAEKIAFAKSYGDLSENEEYHCALDEQSMLEHEIHDIEEKLNSATIEKKTATKSGQISLNSVVKLYDEEFEEEIEYTIVGATEAEPFKNKISSESPIGKALYGKKKGDEIEVVVPTGRSKFKILSVKN